MSKEVIRQKRIFTLMKYAETIKGLPDTELVSELQAYCRRNYGCSEPTTTSYIRTVLEQLPDYIEKKQTSLL